MRGKGVRRLDSGQVPVVNFDSRTITFQEGDLWQVCYSRYEENYCPVGMKVVSSYMMSSKEEIMVTYEAERDITLPEQEFLRSYAIEKREFDAYRRDVEEVIEYRNGLIDEGCVDLRKTVSQPDV